MRRVWPDSLTLFVVLRLVPGNHPLFCLLSFRNAGHLPNPRLRTGNVPEMLGQALAHATALRAAYVVGPAAASQDLVHDRLVIR